VRITNKLMIKALLNDVERAVGNINKFQHQLATSTRINKPSDDPIGAFRVLDLKAGIADNERYLKNIEDGEHYLVVTEASLTDAIEVIQGIKTQVLQAINGSQDAATRDLIAVRLADYIDQLVESANKKEGDKYLFGGTQTTTAPYIISSQVTDEAFTAAADTAVLLDYTELVQGSITVTDPGGGGSYTEGVDYTIDYENGTITALGTGGLADGSNYEIDYTIARPSKVTTNPLGNSGDLIRHIDDAAELVINVKGDDVFNSEIDMFDVLRQLKNSLTRNDVDEMRIGLDNLDACLTQIQNCVTLVGSRLDRLAMSGQRREDEDVLLKSLLSSVSDTDIAETIVRLQTEQVTYETALKTTAELLQTSLLDFLT